MSRAKYMFIVSVVATAVTLASGAFHQALVSDVWRNTVCPMMVEANENPEREPRQITFYKCDSTPNPYLAEQKLTGCCQNNNRGLVTKCVELYDYTDVKYKNSPETVSIKVPVGCTCVIQEIGTPEDISRQSPGAEEPAT